MNLRLVLLFFISIHSAGLFAAPVKLLVKNARLFTMAPQQRESFTGYLAVAEDGKIVSIAKGDPPANLKAAQVLDAH
jgi:5-methylthioadenosine/S-adenosylhomocysteine deaminase